MLLRKGGGGSWTWSQNGEGGGGIFQFVSYCLQTDVDGNMKARHKRPHTPKCVQL